MLGLRVMQNSFGLGPNPRDKQGFYFLHSHNYYNYYLRPIIHVRGDENFLGPPDTAELAEIASDISEFGSFFSFHSFTHSFGEEMKITIADRKA